MATYNISTSVNIDSLASKAGSDTYNINGGYLTVDQDTRYGTNGAAVAAMGNIAMSATLGGTIEFNATKVRLIPYDNGSSTVPASNTTISGAAGSGLLIGVYSALDVAPTAAGAAMPASGYIKIKQWNDGAFVNNEALSGITATVNGTDGPGWIEIVGVDALTITVNRLNTFKVRGDWYYFQGVTTDGNRATTYQIPSNGSSAVYLPGVWVETDVADTYEFYPCAGSRTALEANIGIEAARGKYCWISTAGLLRFGNDGTNSTGGYCPPSGRKIRIPNIFFMCCAAAATVNILPNATPGTRLEFLTTGGGVIDIDKCLINWYVNLSQPFSVSITNTGVMTLLPINECASPLILNNVGIGQEAANTQIGLTITTCLAGGTVTDCTVTRAAQASTGNYVVSMSDITNFTFSNFKIRSLTYRGNATTGSATITRAYNCTFNQMLLGGGRALLTTCDTCTFTDTIYIDTPARNTLVALGTYAYVMATKCVNCTFSGLSFGDIKLVQPYLGLFNIGASACSDIKIRSIGTYASPLSLGDTGRYDQPWTRALTTGIVTSSGHGMQSGNIFYAYQCSSQAAIALGSKTVMEKISDDQFRFIVSNAGQAAGTISYYPTITASLLVLDATAIADDIRVQQVYTDHNRGVSFSSDNSSKNILIENVTTNTPISAPLFVGLNEKIKGLTAVPPMTAQTAVYGTHWFDCYTTNTLPTETGRIPWARTTTLASGISTNHGMYSGMTILVDFCSATGILTGLKTIGVNNSNIFQFACNNAGDTTGTLSYVPLASRVGLVMNEATADTSSTVTLSGSSSFSSAGGLVMSGQGTDLAIFTTPDYIIGHTAFAKAEPVMAGGLLTGYHLYYALDKNDGLGYGAFRNLSLVKNYASGSINANNIMVPDVTDISTGDYVFGTNIAYLAQVTGIAPPTGLFLDRLNTAAVSSTRARFNYLPNEIISAQSGFKQKIKIVSNTTGSTAITSLYYFTESTTGSRSYQYPLDTVAASLNLINLQPGTEIHVYQTNNDFELASNESVTGTSFTYNYTWEGTDINTYITVLKTGYQWIRYSNQTLGQDGLTIPVFQLLDRNYRNP